MLIKIHKAGHHQVLKDFKGTNSTRQVRDLLKSAFIIKKL